MVAQDVEKLKQAFGDQEFTGKDVARVMGMKSYHGTGAMLKSMRRQGIIHARNGDKWQFGTSPEVPQSSAAAQAASAPLAEQPACPKPSLVKVGDLYLHERLLLVADIAIDGVRIYTPIIEIDPTTKHPRNKVITFFKQRDPREHAQVMAWLDGMAGSPVVVDDTALELAAELERKLNAANQENAELKAKIKKLQAIFAEAAI